MAEVDERKMKAAELATEAQVHFETHWSFNRGYRRRDFDSAAFAAHESGVFPAWEIGAGASMAGQFASSVRLAADDLAAQSPLLSGAVRSFADTIEVYAGEVKDRTVEELVQAASDFTRRQPALVFGLAAVAGFLVIRTVKSAPTVAAPPIQPANQGDAFNYPGAG